MGIDNLDKQGRKVDGCLPPGNNCHAGPGSCSKASACTGEEINRSAADCADDADGPNVRGIAPFTF